jgi:hypothetical protein
MADGEPDLVPDLYYLMKVRYWPKADIEKFQNLGARPERFKLPASAYGCQVDGRLPTVTKS